MYGKLKTVVFSLIPAIILLILLEIAGRVLYPFDPDERAMMMAERDPRLTLSYLKNGAGAKAILWDVHRMPRRYVSFLGFLGQPNTSLPTLHTNEFGFRDDAVTPRKSNEVRVLLLGGSTAWGLGASSNDTTIQGVLQRLLNTRNHITYRVMSAAFLSYTARQEMIVLTEFIETFDPDVVVSLTGYNDTLTIMHNTSGMLQQRREAQTLEAAVASQLKPMDTMTALRKVIGSLGVWRFVVYVKEALPLQSVHVDERGSVTYDVIRSQRLASRVTEFHRINAEVTARHGGRYIVGPAKSVTVCYRSCFS